MNDNEEEYNYTYIGLTDEEAELAYQLTADLEADMDEKSDGEILKKLLEDDRLTIEQKIYIAYMFGRTRDKWEEFNNISQEAR